MELTTNKNLRAAALTALEGKWTPAVLTTLVYMVISGIFTGPYQVQNFERMKMLAAGNTTLPSGMAWSSLWMLAGMILVLIPLIYGFYIVFLGTVRNQTEPKIEGLFEGFKVNYGKIIGTMFLMEIYVALWSLLLVIPGIIKMYSYAMTPYILKDEPELGADAVITKSMAMMRGNKMKLFLLDLSFIGWALLAIITCGIGFLWLSPYMVSARAAFYLDLKNAYQAQQA